MDLDGGLAVVDRLAALLALPLPMLGRCPGDVVELDRLYSLLVDGRRSLVTYDFISISPNSTVLIDRALKSMYG